MYPKRCQDALYKAPQSTSVPKEGQSALQSAKAYPELGRAGRGCGPAWANSELQPSLGYTERPCLKRKANRRRVGVEDSLCVRSRLNPWGCKTQLIHLVWLGQEPTPMAQPGEGSGRITSRPLRCTDAVPQLYNETVWIEREKPEPCGGGGHCFQETKSFCLAGLPHSCYSPGTSAWAQLGLHVCSYLFLGRILARGSGLSPPLPSTSECGSCAPLL